jgi:ribosomal protein S18 acetylase RimI-like enzyme
LVADQDGTIAAFVRFGPTLDDDVDPGTGQIYAIYVAPTHWRTGLGRKLNLAALESLRQNGFLGAVLWVLRSNERAQGFYKAMGWNPDGAERTEIMRGVNLDEIRYTHEMP